MIDKQSLKKILWALLAVGCVAFIILLLGKHPERAWQAYLINFLLFSAIAQGGLVFSTVMHTTKARWSGPLSSLAESFTAFFPVSFILFLILFLGQSKLFPWIGLDLHGKEAWLNLPFLFARDAMGLLILYGLGFSYLYHALWFKLEKNEPSGFKLRALLYERWDKKSRDPEKMRSRMNVLSVLYMLAFAVILSLIGFDLVMGMDPHWYSTLFGAYSFIKAVYLGIGGLIILAAVLHLTPNNGFQLKTAQFHDVGKLFLAFCLMWADFFYCQFVVIWYGNITEETAYIIERTMAAPWSKLAWVVFFSSFIIPFAVLLNKKIKTKPVPMIGLATLVIIGIWLEHLLLIGPALSHGVASVPVGILDVAMFFGFGSLMALSVIYFMERFPETAEVGKAPEKARFKERKTR
ncbi:hypothetical protein ACFLZM_02265 [Thermodesulfobacteriota bacterium]